MDAVSHITRANLDTWLETEALKAGTDNQRERWAAAVLPEDELLKLARDEIFAPFASFERWHTKDCRASMLRHFRHAAGCRFRLLAGRDFEVCDVGELSPSEWNRLKCLRDHALEAVNRHPWLVRTGLRAELKTCAHWLLCPSCFGETMRGVARVEIPWAGRMLVREYSL